MLHFISWETFSGINQQYKHFSNNSYNPQRLIEQEKGILISQALQKLNHGKQHKVDRKQEQGEVS